MRQWIDYSKSDRKDKELMRLNYICDSIIREMEINPSFPVQLIEYTKHILENQINGRFYEALIEKPCAVIRGIGNLMCSAGNIVGLSPEELLKQSSFNKNDYNPSKISSLFAEFRAIEYLDIEGFANIQILQEDKTKRADFCANKNGCKYAIEVTNAGYEAKLGHWRHDEIVQLLVNKLMVEGKYKQLENTRDKERCDKMALVLVIDTIDKVALNSSDDYQKMLQDAWELFGKIDQLHLSIITGRVSLGYGKDDVVFPDWQGYSIQS